MVNIKEIGKFMSELDVRNELDKIKDHDWTSWFNLSCTQSLLKFLLIKKIDLQQSLIEVPLSKQENITLASELKGGFEELGRVIESINYLIGDDTSEEDS